MAWAMVRIDSTLVASCRIDTTDDIWGLLSNLRRSSDFEVLSSTTVPTSTICKYRYVSSLVIKLRITIILVRAADLSPESSCLPFWSLPSIDHIRSAPNSRTPWTFYRCNFATRRRFRLAHWRSHDRRLLSSAGDLQPLLRAPKQRSYPSI